MLNSMWSGVSGLRSHQTRMDVIGNDIANVNTIAFKQSNVSFKDSFYNTLTNATAGTNGSQVGTGVGVGQISKDFAGGLLMETGVSSHLAISGDGFFVLRDAAGTQTGYTRAGDFQLSYDSTSGNIRLAGGDGKYLYGTAGGTTGTASTMIEVPSDIQDLIISGDGVVSYVDSTGTLVENAFTVDIATFPSSNGLKSVGGNSYEATVASGGPNFGSTDAVVVQGYIENSNVDLAKEFTEMIVAERGFQANSRTVTTSDSMLQELLSLKR